MERHLFKRTETKKGRKEVRWYYWYYDESGKQVKKSCGQHNKPCYLKREAEAYLAMLEEKDRQEQREYEDARKIRLRDVGATLYDSDSYFMKLKDAHGRNLQPQTIRQKKRIMMFILGEFGDRIPDTIEEGEIENFLVSLDYKNSFKNAILSVFRDLFSECKRLSLVKHRLDIEGFLRTNTRKKDILTMEQLSMMFPDDRDKLAGVWSVRGSDRYIGIDGLAHTNGFMFGVMFRLMASTGLRPGEVRAICIDQIQDGGLFINRMLDAYDVERSYLKKGNAENTRQRTVLLPSKMAELLNEYVKIRPHCDSGYIFSLHGEFIRKGTLDRRFANGLMRLGIIGFEKSKDGNGKVRTVTDKTKHLTPHSLRFTYNTYTVNSNLLPREVLRKMIGHNSEAMTDYYTRPDLDAELRGLQPYQKTVDDIWNKVK